jgi:hypothetical protein
VTSYSDRNHVHDDRAELREAYERGRIDQKRLRRRHPVIMTFLVLAAAIGLVIVALAAVNGSFGSAGQVVDQNLTTAADKAQPAVQNAAAQASEAVRGATTSDRTAQPAQPH